MIMEINSFEISDTGSNNSKYRTVLTVQQEKIANTNESNIIWNCYMTVSGTYFVNWYVDADVNINGTRVLNTYELRSFPNSNSTINLGSGTLRVTHNQDGTKTIPINFNVATVTSQSYLPGVMSKDGEFILDKIDRISYVDQTKFDVSTRPIEQDSLYYLVQPLNTVYNKVELKISGDTNVIATRLNVQPGYNSMLLTAEELEIAYNLLSARVGAILAMTVGTYNDFEYTDLLGEDTRGVYPARILDAEPIFTDYEAEDINATTLALTNNENTIIKDYSSLFVGIVGSNLAIGQKGATITSYDIEGSPIQASDNVSRTIENYSKDTVKVIAYDSRGNSTAVSKILSFVEYYKPVVVEKSVLRDGSVSEETVLNVSGTWFNDKFGAVGDDNVIVASYRYRKSGVQEWTTGLSNLVVNTTDNNFTIDQYIRGDIETGFDINNSYVVEVTITDKLENIIFNLTLGAGIPDISMYVDSTGKHIGYGGTPSAEYNHYFHGSTNINPIEETGNNENGSWIKYNDGTMICTKSVSAFVQCNVAITGSGNNGVWQNSAETIVNLGAFPQTFLAIPTVNITPNGGWNFNLMNIGEVVRSTTQIGTVGLLRYGSAASITMKFDVIAIGRWK